MSTLKQTYTLDCSSFSLTFCAFFARTWAKFSPTMSARVLISFRLKRKKNGCICYMDLLLRQWAGSTGVDFCTSQPTSQLERESRGRIWLANSSNIEIWCCSIFQFEYLDRLCTAERQERLLPSDFVCSKKIPKSINIMVRQKYNQQDVIIWLSGVNPEIFLGRDCCYIANSSKCNKLSLKNYGIYKTSLPCLAEVFLFNLFPFLARREKETSVSRVCFSVEHSRAYAVRCGFDNVGCWWHNKHVFDFFGNYCQAS